jgi:nucleotide-binding universal stress UspA family protein
MQSYRTIVVGTDFSAGSQRGVAAAVRMANRFEASRVHLVHVVPSVPMLPTPLLPDPNQDAAMQVALQKAQERLDAIPLPETQAWVQREVRFGGPARELARAAEAHHADLIVVARRGHSALARLVLGSVPNTLIRLASCPVMVVDEPGEDVRFDRVLAAVDLSPISRLVLDNAVVVAKAYAGRVQVLSLFEHPLLGGEGGGGNGALEESRRRHEEAVAALVRRVPRDGVALDIEVMRKAPVSQTIIDVARQAESEVIVMGTSGRNAWHRMILGSTANHVLLRAHCALLVVPPAVREGVEEVDPVMAPNPALGGNTPC